MAIAKKWDVLALGVTSVDDLLYVAEFPLADIKTHVLSSDRQCGGLSATALVAASRLGAHCAYAGSLGENALSQFVENTLIREGIDTNHIVRREDASPVHATIVVDTSTGTRNIFSDHKGFTGADASLPDEAVICATRVLFVDHHGIDGMIRAAKIARKNSIPVVADIERLSAPRFSELIGLVDHLILSWDFASHLTGQDTPACAARALWTDQRAVVIITCGESGCWALSGEMSDPQHFPAFAVEVVDTTGCGDVFHGAYAGALAQEIGLEDRIRVASAAAALKAAQPGGQKGIPTREELEKFLSAQS